MAGFGDPMLAARVLRSELHPHWGRMGGMQWGIVTAIHPPGTYNSVFYGYSSVDVRLDGSGGTTLNLAFMENYSPMINDWVVVLRMQGPAQTARIVLGSMSPAGTSQNIQNVGLKVGDVTLGTGTVSFTLPVMTGMNNIKLRFRGAQSAQLAFGDNVAIRANGDTTAANYSAETWDVAAAANAVSVARDATAGAYTWASLAPSTSGGAANVGSGEFIIYNYQGSTWKNMIGDTRAGDVGAAASQQSHRFGVWKSTSAITSLGFLSSVGPGTNTLGGNVEIWLEP